MLKLTLKPIGASSRVELNGVDISKYLSAVTVTADAGGITKATLSYTGAVVIEGDPGVLEFVQEPRFVQCADCQKTVQGEPHDVQIVEHSNIGAASREYSPVAE
jgi:hypothetical protein